MPQVLGRRRAVIVIYTPVILVDLCHWLEGGVGNGAYGGVVPPLPDVDDNWRLAFIYIMHW